MPPRYPGAVWLPVGQDLGANNGPVSFAWHTAITTAQTLTGWVESSNACHGYVAEHGEAEQYKDFDRAVYGTLDGNYKGVVTIESWDGLPVATATYDDVNAGSWTGQQCERIADWVAFADVALGIPIQRLHGTRDRGHGGHCTGISNRASSRGLNLYEGPDRWSTDMRKPCPGDLRIIQLYGPALDGGAGSILARARAISAHVRAGGSYLPPGPVNLPAALARGGGALQLGILEWIAANVR